MSKAGILAELHALGQETANGNSASFKAAGERIGVAIRVSAVVTSVDFEIEWSPDGTNFGSADTTADTFAQFVAPGVKAKAFDVKAPFFRLKWTTADATFLATAH